jgi:hypothetical protein
MYTDIVDIAIDNFYINHQQLVVQKYFCEAYVDGGIDYANSSIRILQESMFDTIVTKVKTFLKRAWEFIKKVFTIFKTAIHRRLKTLDDLLRSISKDKLHILAKSVNCYWYSPGAFDSLLKTVVSDIDTLFKEIDIFVMSKSKPYDIPEQIEDIAKKYDVDKYNDGYSDSRTFLLAYNLGYDKDFYSLTLKDLETYKDKLSKFETRVSEYLNKVDPLKARIVKKVDTDCKEELDKLKKEEDDNKRELYDRQKYGYLSDDDHMLTYGEYGLKLSKQIDVNQDKQSKFQIATSLTNIITYICKSALYLVEESTNTLNSSIAELKNAK